MRDKLLWQKIFYIKLKIMKNRKVRKKTEKKSIFHYNTYTCHNYNKFINKNY